MPKKYTIKSKKLSTKQKEIRKAKRKSFILKKKLIRSGLNQIQEIISIANKNLLDIKQDIDVLGNKEKKELMLIENVVESLSRKKNEFLGESNGEKDKTVWLDNLPYDLLKSFSLLVDKLQLWISPFRKGSQGMGGKISVDVSDGEMDVFIEQIKNDREWKLKKNT